jgi:hypothetical protein
VDLERRFKEGDDKIASQEFIIFNVGLNTPIFTLRNNGR